jgi:hypothetical protein
MGNSGNDNYIEINSNAAQLSHDFGDPTSTGFTITSGDGYNGIRGWLSLLCSCLVLAEQVRDRQ